MTDVTTLLAGIKAQSEGLTDLCPGYLRQGIRHLQRNCDVECSAHEEDGTWLDCNQPGRYDGDRMARALASIPLLVAALEAVAEMHKPYAICDECECPEGTHPEDYEFIDCLDYSSCDNSITGWACAECCSDAEGYNTEECADGHKHTMNKDKRCPTITAVVAALGEDK